MAAQTVAGAITTQSRRSEGPPGYETFLSGIVFGFARHVGGTKAEDTGQVTEVRSAVFGL